MPGIKIRPLSTGSVNRPVSEVLRAAGAEQQIVSDQLNTTLKAELISATNSEGQTVLASVIQTIGAADLAADENLSLRDFVTKHATLPTEPSARQAAQVAIATLSSTTTVGAFLGLSTTVAANSIFSGIVAQTHLAELLSTSSTPLSAQLQTEFIQKYAAYQGTMQDFWTQLTDRWQRTAGVGGEREKKTAPLSYRLARIPIPRHL